MKKMICAAAMLLSAASLIFAQNGALQIRATGTGNTTGHVANLSLYNPTNQTVTFTLSPSFIPSGGQYQPYIVPTPITSTVPSGATANVPVNGFCTDIARPPVPNGEAMSPISGWLTANQDATAASLLDAINRVSTTFDKMKDAGAITTPFSGNPEKEREAVIQQTFWIYNSGDTYTKEDFKANTIKQFETSTGLVFEKTDEKTQSSVNAGVEQFWNTFEAVGAEAKVLKSPGMTVAGPGAGGEIVEIGNKQDKKKDKCACEEITVDVMIGNDKITATGKFGKGEPAVVDQSQVAANKIGANTVLPVTISKITVKCGCDAGLCKPCSATTTSLDDLKKVETNEAYAAAEALLQEIEVARENLRKDPKNKDKQDALKKLEDDYKTKLEKAKLLEKENGKVNGDYKSVKNPTVKGEKINGGNETGAWNAKGEFEHLQGKPAAAKGFPMVTKNKKEALTYEFTVEANCVSGDCSTAKCVKSFKLTLENKK